MKKQFHSLALGLLFAAGTLSGFAQSTEFTYQGRLTDNGVPAQTAKEIRFTLCSDAVGSIVPALSKPNPTAAVPVLPVNGLFTVKLDFGSEAFAGAKRFLKIEVKPQGAADAEYAILQPMAELTVAPYAIYASKAGDFVAGASPTFTGTPSFNGPGAPFTVGNNNKVVNLNADLLDGKDSSAFVLKAGDTMSGSLTVNAGFNAVVGNSSSGTASAGITGRSTAINGNGIIAEANYGSSAYALWAKSSNGFAGVFDGNVRITGDTDLDGDATAIGSFNCRDTSGGPISAYIASTTFGGQLLLADEAGKMAVFASALPDSGGQISIWGPNAAVKTIEMKAAGDASTEGGQILMKQANNVITLQLDAEAGANGGGYLGVYRNDGVRTVEISGGNATTCGKVRTPVLEITGGCDLSEQFDINGVSGEPQPGMLVSIDPAHAGQLVMSSRAYDCTVAGVVSGAGGVNPGMVMGQQGWSGTGKHPVALTGRVYCQVDADQGAIQPGDLITTSATPGHGMKATDHDKAQGAIIGKAMTALSKGKGLVLLLVSLQ